MSVPGPNILILDPEPAAAQFLANALSQTGAMVTTAHNKADAFAKLEAGRFEMVFVDPSPLKDAHALILQIRRKIPTYSYVVLMSQEERVDPMAVAANDALMKPAPQLLAAEMVQNGRALLALMRRLNNVDEDFPSSRGVIAKSAFCQLFASALDRADRYAERSHVLFIRLVNVDQIRVQTDEYTATTVAATLIQQISRLRRQSDILAQTGTHEYALMLQRPAYDTEPVEAALRFADAIAHNTALLQTTKSPIAVRIMLIEVPTGAVVADHNLELNN